MTDRPAGLPEGFTASELRFKDANHYLDSDGDNPEAPWQGYGWPLGTECWYVVLEGYGRRWWATGATQERAMARAEKLAWDWTDEQMAKVPIEAYNLHAVGEKEDLP